ncbi:MAG: hypothetical protein LBH20_05505 [Treponema sp.]|jgi:hypothetical protein|nr:hypothetical protein [Treponema sp.]
MISTDILPIFYQGKYCCPVTVQVSRKGRCGGWRKHLAAAHTPNGIAKALNLEAYELLIPENSDQKTAESQTLQRIADIIKVKKALLRQKTSEIIDDLMLEIIRNYNE